MLLDLNKKIYDIKRKTNISDQFGVTDDWWSSTDGLWLANIRPFVGHRSLMTSDHLSLFPGQ